MESDGQKGGGEGEGKGKKKNTYTPHLTSSDFPDLDIALCYGFASLTCQDITSHRAQI